MKQLLLLIAAGAMMLSSCNKDDNDPGAGGTTAGGGDIVFNIGIGSQMQTKVTTGADFKSAFEHGDEIGIFAVRRASGATGTALELATSGNYIHNVKLTYSTADGGKWTAASGLWFPNNGDVLDFYAYYPYDDNNSSPATLDPTAITFNVQADQSTALNYGKSDLLRATPQLNVAKSTTPVTLSFAHQLSLVQVEVDPTYIDRNGGFTATLNNCKAGGAFNLSTGNLATVGNAAAVKMLRVEKPADANYTTKYTYRALVPAQSVAQGASLCLMVQNGQLFNTPTLAAALTLTAGNAYRYTAKLPATALQTVKITHGTFTMGSPTTEPNRQGNETQHSVTLSKDFYMSKYAVTFAQYDAFCDATSRTKPIDEGWGRDNRPVINVTWNDAVAYCTWLSEQTGQTWRLPTEAEWEYACRAGTTTPFSLGTAGNGNSFVSTQGNFWWSYPYDVEQGGNYNDNTKTPLGKTQPVGSYAPNAWGLYDMHGNVWEWCLDYCNWPPADYGLSAVTDPLVTAGSSRVLRGGSWYINAQDCRSAYRDYNLPDNAYSIIGFRVVFVPWFTKL